MFQIDYLTDQFQTEWNDFVEKSPNANIGHLLGWKTVMEEYFGRETCYLLAHSGSAVKGPRDVNGNGQLDPTEIQLWQEEQESGRLAWLMLMMARAAVDRLRSEGGSTIRAEKMLNQGLRSFDQGDMGRAMTLAGRVRAEARRALERIQRKKEEQKEDEEDHGTEFQGLEEKEMKELLGQDQETDRIGLAQLQGLMNLVHELNRRLVEPPEYVATIV